MDFTFGNSIFVPPSYISYALPNLSHTFSICYSVTCFILLFILIVLYKAMQKVIFCWTILGFCSTIFHLHFAVVNSFPFIKKLRYHVGKAANSRFARFVSLVPIFVSLMLLAVALMLPVAVVVVVEVEMLSLVLLLLHFVNHFSLATNGCQCQFSVPIDFIFRVMIQIYKLINDVKVICAINQ